MFEDNNYSDYIDDVLCKLHISKKRKGYLYLKRAIELLHERYRSDKKAVFRIVGHEYGVSYDAVETAIRRCIKDGIVNCPSQNKIEVFGYDIEANHRCSRNYYTTSEFITYIMNYIHKITKE